MITSSARSTSRKWLGVWTVTVLAVATLGVPSQSDGASLGDRAAPEPAGRSGSAERLGNYDARLIGGDLRATATLRQVRENGKAVRALSKRLGAGAVIDIDPLTGTPDEVSARTALTRPSGRSAAAIALGFVREHLAAFGLDDADLGTLVKVRQYTRPQWHHPRLLGAAGRAEAGYSATDCAPTSTRPAD